MACGWSPVGSNGDTSLKSMFCENAELQRYCIFCIFGPPKSFEMTVEEREQKAGELFKAGYNCCQSVAMTFADVLGMSEDEVARITSGFGGGMGRMREVCGTVSAMTMIAGAMIPATDVNDKQAKTANYALVQEMADEFKQNCGSILCRELLGLSKPEGTPVPSDRTPEYYKKRPCGELCSIAAGIIARKLKIEN